MGSKGGGSQKTESTVTQSNLPEYAEPYFHRLMERAEGLSLAEYNPYEGQRQADLDPMMEQGYDMVSGIAGAGLPYADDAAGVMYNNINQAMDMSQDQYDPYQFSQYGDFQAGQATPFAGYEQFQFGDPRQFNTQEASSYMSPYIDNVLTDRMENIRRQYDISQAGRDAQAVQAGAFGGSRDAVVNSLAQEDLMRQLDDVYNEGLSSAYDQAMGQFNADRAAQMDSTYRQAGENARYQDALAQELARTQGISIDEARRIQAAEAAELGRVQSSQSAEDYNAYITNRQSELEALGFSSDQAMNLLGIGSAQRDADVQSAQLLDEAGRSLMGYDQAALDTAYDDFLRQQGFPESQLTLLSSIMRGVPISPSQTTTTYTPYNPYQTYLGGGLAALGLAQGLG